MPNLFRSAIILGLLLAAPFLRGAEEGALAAGLVHWELTVDGAQREALVHIPPSASTAAAPVVFAFHGHGGSARGAERMFPIDRVWPEAISVYMQGLNTPGRLTDPEGKKPGWQQGAGAQGDRDLHFFDAVLARLKQEYKVDAARLYSTGHSNGGGFTYLLWAERGDLFAAMAPSAAAAAASLPKLKPKPALHIAGQNDPLVKFEWQQRTMEAVRKLNGCAAQGQLWVKECTLYPSESGTPFIAWIHPGAHIVPPGAPEVLVKFFKEHPAR
jgi:polyhydroxybutyrate depolymerase